MLGLSPVISNEVVAFLALFKQGEVARLAGLGECLAFSLSGNSPFLWTPLQSSKWSDYTEPFGIALVNMTVLMRFTAGLIDFCIFLLLDMQFPGRDV